MPHISEMKQSKFLTKTDVGNGILVTIKDCIQENVAVPGAAEDLKWCLEFSETEKPLVLNSTNAQICAAILGSENTDDWVGKKIVLYTDPHIQYAGRIVGGIRVRAPKGQAAQAKPNPITKPAAKPLPPPPEPEPEPEGYNPDDPDDVPF